MALQELLLTLGVRADTSALGRIGKQLREVNSAALLAAGGIAALGTAAISAVSSALDTARLAQEINTTASSLNLTASALQELQFAGRQAGLSNSELASGLQELQTKLFDAGSGSKKARKAFRDLGVSFRNADGSLRTVDQVLPDIADGYNNLTDAVKRTGVAQKFLGTTGEKAAELLGQGSEGIRQAREQAQELGGVLGDELIAQSEEFADNLNILKFVIQGFSNIVASVVLPVLNGLISGLTSVVSWVRGSAIASGILKAGFIALGGVIALLALTQVPALIAATTALLADFALMISVLPTVTSAFIASSIQGIGTFLIRTQFLIGAMISLRRQILATAISSSVAWAKAAAGGIRTFALRVFALTKSAFFLGARLVGAALRTSAAWAFAAARGLLPFLARTLLLIARAPLLAARFIIAAARTTAAWVLAAAPFLAILALFGIIFLVLEDLYTFLRGGESVVGKLGDAIAEWLTTSDSLLATVIRSVFDFIQAVIDFISTVISKGVDLVRFLISIPSRVIEAAKGAAAAIAGIAKNLLDGFLGAIDRISAGIRGLVSDLTDALGLTDQAGIDQAAQNVGRSNRAAFNAGRNRVAEIERNLQQVASEGFGTFTPGQGLQLREGVTEAQVQQRLQEIQNNVTVNVDATGATDPQAVGEASARATSSALLNVRQSAGAF